MLLKQIKMKNQLKEKKKEHLNKPDWDVLVLDICKSKGSTTKSFRYIELNSVRWGVESSYSTWKRNHRMVEVWKNLWRSSDPTPLLEQGHPKQVAQDHVLPAFEYPPQLLWAACATAQSSSQVQKKKVSLCSERTCVSVCAHGLICYPWVSYINYL